jgi:pseudouridine-5'-phosphate glycosidase
MSTAAIPPLRFCDEVQAARSSGQPIVALESALIAHGLPWPANLETAVQAECVVRQSGAVPATIAVLDGEMRIGLTVMELERLATQPGIEKAGRGELPWLLARRGTGATTVSATLFLAHAAAIVVLATGGIGGVHRGWAGTADISSDLIELAHTPVAVVCAGAKAILDLAATLEFLETHGVAVIGYGTDELPGFFTPCTGLRLEHRVDAPDQAAELIVAARRLGMTSGVVIANPPPRELCPAAAELERWIASSLEEAATAGIRGKALTPFLLDRLRFLGGPQLLAANRALIIENARVAAEIARALQNRSSAGPLNRTDP